MTVYYDLKPGATLTEEQIRELDEAAKRPIVYDEDAPELTPDMMRAAHCAVLQRNHLLKYAGLPLPVDPEAESGDDDPS